MNTHDIDIELPPLPTEGGLQEAIRLGPDFVGSLMQSYALAAITTYQQGGNAKQYYNEIMKDDTEEPDPIEDLRFFCSLAMRQQDWLDVEPFFDAIEAYVKRIAKIRTSGSCAVCGSGETELHTKCLECHAETVNYEQAKHNKTSHADRKKFGRNDSDKENDNDNRKRRDEPVAWLVRDSMFGTWLFRSEKPEPGLWKYVKTLYETPQPAEPVSQHPDDAAVDAFAAAMKAKLAKKRAEGRGNWQMCTSTYLSRLLREHVEKGDPVDVANLAMMLHQNGQHITLVKPVKVSSVREFEEWLNDNRRHDVSSVFHEIVARYTKAAQPQQIPEGYKLAPVEPTQEMLQAAYLAQQPTAGFRTVGEIRLDANRHPYACLLTGYDEHGDQWKEGTPIYAALQPAEMVNNEFEAMHGDPWQKGFASACRYLGSKAEPVKVPSESECFTLYRKHVDRFGNCNVPAFSRDLLSLYGQQAQIDDSVFKGNSLVGKWICDADAPTPEEEEAWQRIEDVKEEKH